MHACLLALQCAFVVALIRARMATVVPCVAQTNLGRSHVRSSTQRKAPSNVEVHVPPACFSFVYVRPSCYAFQHHRQRAVVLAVPQLLLPDSVRLAPVWPCFPAPLCVRQAFLKGKRHSALEDAFKQALNDVSCSCTSLRSKMLHCAACVWHDACATPTHCV